MSASIPNTMLAVAQEPKAEEFVQNSPAFTGSKHPEMQAAVLKVKVPELEENDVLVKVEYAAQVSEARSDAFTTCIASSSQPSSVVPPLPHRLTGTAASSYPPRHHVSSGDCCL
jgi:hypothetical protein